MSDNAIEPVLSPREQQKKWQAEFETAREALVTAEAELAAYQAEVNAFRMHCRLKLDDLVDELLVLNVEKQDCLTRLQLLRQEQEAGVMTDEADPLRPLPDDQPIDELEPDLILPTDVPHDKAAEKRLYRELARRFHPDLANTAVARDYATMMMTAVNNAYEKRDIQTLYDLAGELEPEAMAELEGIETSATRKLRQQVMQVQRRLRRVQQQMKWLRQENTARLYHRAQRLEEAGDNWWDIVRRELEAAIERRQEEISRLQKQLALLETR
ncbi:MAG: J domain-containing protein [Ardenticatenaceae bacterium]|nr:J domain-containing protein [Ardenticatenaceae bacterium]MCB9443511.1 J domain-containing protein [Ardenticatenaceae bacterium]